MDHLSRQTVFTRTGMFATTVVRPPGVTDQYAYTNGLLTMSQPAGSAATYFRYGVNAQIDSVWGAGTRTERRFLQANGNVDSVRMARTGGAEIVRYRYDGSGRLDKVTDHTGDSTTYAYDSGFGNIRRVLVPTGLVDSTFFDGYGRDSVLASTGQPNRTVLYDAVNRATHLYDGVNTNPTLTQYDALYDTTVTDPRSQVYRFHRNPLGWVTREYTANSTSVYTSFRYDAAGQLTSWTNRRGERVNLTYDGLGRLKTKSGDNTTTDSLSFSEATGISIAIAKNVVASDTVLVEEQAGTRTATYGLGGKRFQVIYKTHPSLSTPDTATMSCTNCGNGLSFYTRSFHYDTTSGALAALHIGSAVSFFSYGAEMELTTTSYPAFQPRHESYTTSTQRYDSRFDSAAVNQTLRRAYRFDHLGRIERDQRQAGVNRTVQRSFGYDGLSRLTDVGNRTQGCVVWPGGDPDSLSAQFGWRYTCAGAAATESYSYDAAGNRTSQSGTYADGNRVSALGVFTFEHDADGNITRRQNSSTGQDRRYYWSAENLLDSVVTVGGDRVGYQHNVSGQPVVRTRNGSVERYFLYDGRNLLIELDASFNRLAEYVHLGTDAPFAMITGSTTPTTIGYHQQDGLGNVAGIHNGSSISQHILYTTWGTPTFQTSTTNRLAWKGLLYEGDGVELYYMRARWYDPEIGRFISEDPIGLSGGINQYAFAGNDPVNGWDPSGLIGCTDAYIRQGYVTTPGANGQAWCVAPATLATATVTARAGIDRLAAMMNPSSRHFSLSDLMDPMGGVDARGWWPSNRGNRCTVRSRESRSHDALG